MGRVRTLVASQFPLLAIFAAYLGLSLGLARAFQLNTSRSLPSIPATAAAAIPFLLWLVYIQWQRRQSRGSLLRLSVLALIGALAAGPVAAFIAELGSSPNSTNADIALLGENRWLYAIAIVGLTQEASKYLVATLPILRSSECRSGDQVISLQASSIGFAAFVSYQHLRSPGLHTSLTGAAILTITLTLTHLTLSGTVSAIASLLTTQSRARVPGQFAMSTAIVSAAILTAAALNGSILMVSDTPRFHLGIVLFSFVAVHLFAPRITLAPPVSRLPRLLAQL